MKIDPVDDILDSVQSQLDDKDSSEPVMPFPTALVLTREQEENAVEHALQRFETLETEMGRDIAGTEDSWRESSVESQDGENTRSPHRTFIGKRKLFELTYNNKMEWRATPDSIYESSNLVVPLARRICRQMIARANKYFFGTDPWFAAYPVGNNDKELARKAMKFGQYKARQAGSRALHEEANEKAFVLGEGVVKSTYKIKESFYNRKAEVLTDALGRDILDSTGEYITPEAKWSESPEGEMVLAKDGFTPMPENLVWTEKVIDRKRTQYHAPEQSVINYRDFLCPLDAKNTEEADICIHIYDTPTQNIVDQWAKRGMINLSAAKSDKVTQKALEVLRNIHGTAAGENNSSRDSARASLGESTGVTDTYLQESSSRVAECYMRHDVNGDGLLEDILIIIDINNRTPIFYDYVANITPDGLRPFDVVRINPVSGRWHGVGAMEMYETTQNIVDLLINRWNFAQTKAARVDFWNPQATLQGQDDPDLELNGGETYTLANGKTAEEALQSIYLYENKGNDLRELTEFFLQMAMNESGIQHANDNFIAGMDSTKLATGIRNVEKTGQEMFALYLSHLEPGHNGVAQRFFDLLMANIRPDEVITYFEDDNPEELLTIAAADLEEVKLNVSILLTRQRGEELIESSIRSIDLVERFYSFPPEIQSSTAPMFRDMLRVFNISNVEEVIQVQQALGAEGMPQGNTDAQEVAASAASTPRSMAPNI